MTHRLSKAQARQVAVRAQVLHAARATRLVPLVEQLTMLQLDPTAAIAPSADLVARSRLGPSYRAADLKRALEQDGTLYEFDAGGATNAAPRRVGSSGLTLARDDRAYWPRV